MVESDTDYPNPRRYPRAPGPFEGWCLGTAPTPVRVTNLGLGGCFVTASLGEVVEESLTLQIDLGRLDVIEVSAATVYRDAAGSAVTFLNLGPDEFARIQRTVEGARP